MPNADFDDLFIILDIVLLTMEVNFHGTFQLKKTLNNYSININNKSNNEI